MPSSNFLNTPFGGASTAKFEMGGISQLFLLPYSKLTDTVDVLDAFGSVTAVSGVTLADTAKFQEIGFVENTASYTDAYKPSATKRYMEVSLSFTVDASGSAAVDQAHQILLTRHHVALVRRKNGKFYLLGLSNGLVPSDGNANSGAKREDDSAITFTLTGGNLGFAPEVTMDAVSLAAITSKLV